MVDESELPSQAVTVFAGHQRNMQFCIILMEDYAFSEQKQEELQSCSLQNKNNNHRKIGKMKRQRIISKMKEQDKIPEKQLN